MIIAQKKKKSFVISSVQSVKFCPKHCWKGWANFVRHKYLLSLPLNLRQSSHYEAQERELTNQPLMCFGRRVKQFSQGGKFFFE